MSKARQLADLGNVYDDGALSNRNRIINGSMTIDQRNGGSAVTIPAAVTYVVDRWLGFSGNASRFSLQQNAGAVTPPVGFKNYLGATSLSAHTSGAAEAFLINHYVEGFNTADFAFGTANATAITLSFWVRSSLTGTFAASFANAASTRVYISTYSIASANTWEYKTITISGDTTGTWDTGNGIGIQVRFDLGSGSNYQGAAGAWGTSNITTTSGAQSIVGTSGATFYITGVQLEKGDTATPFEHRSYGDELARCMRFATKYTGDGSGISGIIAHGASSSASGSWCLLTPQVPMRATPTISYSSLIISDSTTFDATVSGLVINGSNGKSLYVSASHTASSSAGTPVNLRPSSGSYGYLLLDAEL